MRPSSQTKPVSPRDFKRLKGGPVLHPLGIPAFLMLINEERDRKGPGTGIIWEGFSQVILNDWKEVVKMWSRPCETSKVDFRMGVTSGFPPRQQIGPRWHWH